MISSDYQKIMETYIAEIASKRYLPNKKVGSFVIINNNRLSLESHKYQLLPS